MRDSDPPELLCRTCGSHNLHARESISPSWYQGWESNLQEWHGSVNTNSVTSSHFGIWNLGDENTAQRKGQLPSVCVSLDTGYDISPTARPVFCLRSVQEDTSPPWKGEEGKARGPRSQGSAWEGQMLSVLGWGRGEREGGGPSHARRGWKS